MVREYELMYIVRPELADEAIEQAVASVRSIVEAQGGEVVKSTMWGRRRLAYEVQHLRDGFYVIDSIRLDAGRIGEVEGALRIHDQVFRHMLVLQESSAGSEEPVTAPAAAEEAPTEPGSPGGSEAVINEEELDAVPAAVEGDDL